MDNDINKWPTTGLRASVARTQQTNNVDGSCHLQCPEPAPRSACPQPGRQFRHADGEHVWNLLLQPLSDLIQNENYSRNTQVWVNAFADIKLWKGLVFRTEYAANFNYSNDYKFTPPTTTSTSSSSRQQAVEPATEATGFIGKLILLYNNTFGKHGLCHAGTRSARKQVRVAERQPYQLPLQLRTRTGCG